MNRRTNTPRDRLRTIIAAETSRSVPETVVASAAELRRRFGASTVAIVFYGSALRDGLAPDSLLDFYVVVDNLRDATGHWLAAIGAQLLPPNVYLVDLVDLSTAHGPVRAKVALIGRQQFFDGTRSFSSHLWARLAQPAAIVYARDNDTRACIADGLATAVETMIARAIPLMADRFDAGRLWIRALEETYGAEVRPESARRADGIVMHNPNRYVAVTTAVLGSPDVDGRYRPRPSRMSEAAWGLRRRWGKLLNLMRLAKAAFTFQGGLDYAVDKIARHSGVSVKVSDADRKRPLRAGWRILREARRRGGLR